MTRHQGPIFIQREFHLDQRLTAWLIWVQPVQRIRFGDLPFYGQLVETCVKMVLNVSIFLKDLLRLTIFTKKTETRFVRVKKPEMVKSTFWHTAPHPASLSIIIHFDSSHLPGRRGFRRYFQHFLRCLHHFSQFHRVRIWNLRNIIMSSREGTALSFLWCCISPYELSWFL